LREQRNRPGARAAVERCDPHLTRPGVVLRMPALFVP
jgi:hypothetical protein